MLKYLKRILGFNKSRLVTARPELVVLITGCDSGLGFRIAQAAHERGLTVVAGFLGGGSGTGKRRLQELARPRPPLHLLDLDVTKEESVQNMKLYVQQLLKNNPNYSLHAVVNNAGVMTMGEFEWQTSQMLENQLSVNVAGTWRVSKALLGLLRQAAARGGAPRVLNVSSHCGSHPLRTMAPYSATKAALRAWADALRMELRYYGVYVVNYVPGRMITNTNILTEQSKKCQEMKTAMNEEQRKFFGSYFDQFSSYMAAVSQGEKEPDQLNNQVLEETFMKALLEERPDTEYINEPWRYTFYYNLFKITPMTLRYWLVDKFLCLPTYNAIK